jgi:5-(carboxyamino)imidazole ribonucleotide synthase
VIQGGGGPDTVRSVAGQYRVGVIGAGQLGQMMIGAGVALGLELHFLSEDPHDPAAQASPHHFVGAATDPDAVAALAARTDVVTCEHELVDLNLLAELSTPVYPSASTLAAVVDKGAMRAAIAGAGLPSPPWRIVTSETELRDAVQQWPDVVAKALTGGYDGRGLCFIRSGEVTDQVLTWYREIGPNLLLEPFLDIAAELAVVIARGIDGNVLVYDPVRTVQIGGQCRTVLAPHGLGADIDAAAREIAITVANNLEVVGILAVEMFVVNGKVLVNELAARPHNSGHHTLDACVTSQFENHLRAVAGLPLGSTQATSRAAVMVNLIAVDGQTDPRSRRGRAFEVDPRVRLHLYGKHPRPQRKVGHVTVLAEDLTEATALAWQAVRALGCDDRERDARRQVENDG